MTTKQQTSKARNLMLLSGLTRKQAITLVKRREARLNSNPTFTGSVVKAQPFAIL